MKIVINNCFGGFAISRLAAEYMAEHGSELAKHELEGASASNKSFCRWVKRDDPLLIEVVEKLKEEANGRSAALKIVEIPDNVEWVVDEYDGSEWVAEKHRTWR